MKKISAAPVSKRHGFTIIELLVVVTIIAVLAGLVISQAPKMMEDARRLEVRNVLISIRNGIHNYQVEYNRYPLDANQSASSGGAQDLPAFQTDENNGLIQTLMGDAANMSGVQAAPDPNSPNPKGIEFATFKIAQNGRNGLIGTQPPFRLVDMWSVPYWIQLDTNMDRKVQNPDVQNQDPKISQNMTNPPPQFLPTDVIIYSNGKDKTQQTGDDIVTWRDN
jgi:prepilin-type N-terminal cleavage/methylation domain-containing protein